jgi:glucose-6-phosphate isomerase
MVILPYKDGLDLFSKYFQQCIEEMLEPKSATNGRSNIQQLRTCLNNFFVIFIKILNDECGSHLSVEPSVTSENFLKDFYFGIKEIVPEKNQDEKMESIFKIYERLSANSHPKIQKARGNTPFRLRWISS